MGELYEAAQLKSLNLGSSVEDGYLTTSRHLASAKIIIHKSLQEGGAEALCRYANGVYMVTKIHESGGCSINVSPDGKSIVVRSNGYRDTWMIPLRGEFNYSLQAPLV